MTRILVIALAGLAAGTGPALAQDSADASQGSSQGAALSSEAAATLSEAGVKLAWTGSVATGQSAAIVFADELAQSQAVLDVWDEASGGPLPVDGRVMVAGPRPDVPRQAQSAQAPQD